MTSAAVTSVGASFVLLMLLLVLKNYYTVFCYRSNIFIVELIFYISEPTSDSLG